MRFERWTDDDEKKYNNLDLSSNSIYDLDDEEIGLVIEYNRMDYYREFFGNDD